ncbi:fatty acid desaturase [Simiduia sp. 21SJ11W-1]|uniref:fatty acid desaturase n=1 Tax=Simiduia sp. 21SJ11W-1 TaxID=2909669 RepID=UPI0020A1085B|nr:fatty acid desaturase [Simiduia sp. 21SJ11W-1]UTA48997.1 fatty acid desaturase [Simiduia sp. 21SJ11W-1]
MNSPEAVIRWYKSPIDKDAYRKLLEKKDAPGLVYFLGGMSMLVALGVWAYLALGSLWSYVAFFLYGNILVVFASSALHETHHRTAFKSRWLNEVVHWISGFMITKEAEYDRWRHLQHHSFTLYENKDPEIYAGRPPVHPLLIAFLGVLVYPREIIIPFIHAIGIQPGYLKGKVAENTWRKIVWSSRLYVVVALGIVAWAVLIESWLPIVYTFFAAYYGGVLMIFVQSTQHAGLAINEPDHRLTTRTTYMNPFMRFIYWDMNYHIEHHMFAGVPFHSLARLHELVKSDMPEPAPSFSAAVREAMPAWIKVLKSPDDFIRPELPARQA